MTDNEYLRRILENETLNEDGSEMKALRERRSEVEALLRAHFSKSTVSIRWGGSKAKGTMIASSYDGDMTAYFPHDEVDAGSTLKEIFDAVEASLGTKYAVQRKASVLRIFKSGEDLHFDVVPGRYTDDTKTDVFLHRTTGEKERLKTNLQVHIDHIRDSDVLDEIRLMKLWKVRYGLVGVKTFILELLVVKLLGGRKNLGIVKRLEHVLTELCDSAENLAVEDPANPSGNDLKPLLDEARWQLQSVAKTTLDQIENNGWEAVFGPLPSNDGEECEKNARRAALGAAVSAVRRPTRPWLPKP